MLKYAIAGTVGAIAVIAAGFLVLARFNDRNAEAGPAPIVTITVSDTSVAPDKFEIERGRLVELKLANHTAGGRSLSLRSDDVEQLPVETALVRGAAGNPLPNIRLQAGPNSGAAAYARFKASGEYRIEVQAAAGVSTSLFVTVTVP